MIRGFFCRDSAHSRTVDDVSKKKVKADIMVSFLLQFTIAIFGSIFCF